MNVIISSDVNKKDGTKYINLAVILQSLNTTHHYNDESEIKNKIYCNICGMLINMQMLCKKFCGTRD